MLVDYWHSVDLDQGLLDGIIEDWKTKAVAEGDKGRERGGTVRAITSYEQGATHKHWRRRHIMEYLSTRGAVMPQISTALMKRKPTDLPSPQYHYNTITNTAATTKGIFSSDTPHTKWRCAQRTPARRDNVI